jgi:2-dehydropantoate 2-reductase
MSGRRWIIIGAGAVGGTIGARLFQGGADVVLVTRGAHGAAIISDGLLMRDPEVEVRLHIECVLDPSEIEWQDRDVIVLATKTQDATVVLDAVGRLAPGIDLVCATNGVEAERLALRIINGVHAMCVVLPAAHLEPGVVEASSSPCSGVLAVGRATGGYDDVDVDLAADLRAGAFVADHVSDAPRRKRTKLLLNLSNVIEAACGPAAANSTVAARARAEGACAMEAAGLDFDLGADALVPPSTPLHIRAVGSRPRHGGSTWQSLARGLRTTEADYLNGEVSLLGRLHGVPTPVNCALQRLAAHLSYAGIRPGTMSLPQVESWIGMNGKGVQPT